MLSNRLRSKRESDKGNTEPATVPSMQLTVRFELFTLFTTLALALSSAQCCFAQDAFDIPQLQGATMGTLADPRPNHGRNHRRNHVMVNNVPYLQGATMGTIGPQGCDETVITGSPSINAAPSLNGASSNPVVPQIFAIQRPLREHSEFFVCGTALVSLAIFLGIKKKNATMWEMGMVASMVLGASGFVSGMLLFQ